MTRAVWALSAFLVFVAGLAPGAGRAAHGATPISVAVLDFELVDTSLEGASYGADEAEARRLVVISDLLRELLARSGEYKIADTAPAREDIAAAGLIHGCNGCEIGIARSLDAQHVITGIVHKVSTLILGIHVTERDVATGRTLRVSAAQIRGNTDESWTRGLRWLVRNRLVAKPQETGGQGRTR